jgi:membrane protein DedA with SNARE-associated domain
MLNLLPALLPYGGVLLAAIVEGEIAYITAATLVAHGRLDPFGVIASGTLGAAIGDQAWFYAFRGRLPRWIARYPAIGARAAPLLARVRRHAALMVLLIRFAPGLRIALASACAWVEVPPWKFSILNLVSAFVWASVLLIAIGWLGPAGLARVGLGGWPAALVIGAIVLGVFKLIGSFERRALDVPPAE